jgi:5'-nucleotidase/UDP-sugar diphosphatase
MKRLHRIWAILPALWMLPSQPALADGDGVVEFTILQINDVYEIAPLDGGDVGGLARVAALREELRAQNPNTFTVLAGDFFSPSALGTAVVDGRPLAGRQMVDALNNLGLDLATFGNHEFDLVAEDFHARLAQSRFAWVSSNVTGPDDQPLCAGPDHRPIPARRMLDVCDAEGDTVRVGVLGLTIAVTGKDFARTTDSIEAARAQVAALEADGAQVIIALTHLDLAGDQHLAEAVPRIDLILGGHEHVNNSSLIPRSGRPPIFKADANARTAYVHRVRFDGRSKTLRLDSNLRALTGYAPLDPRMAAVVQSWIERAYDAFRKQGFEPDRRIATLREPLDGREEKVRYGSTNLTELIGRAMLSQSKASPAGAGALAIYNSGSIRLDDILAPGPITEYDVLRILPFGGDTWVVPIRGATLSDILTRGLDPRRHGEGNFLQAVGASGPVAHAGDGWTIAGAPIDPGLTYPVAVNDYYLNRSLRPLYPELRDVGQKAGELRRGLIDELEASPTSP